MLSKGIKTVVAVLTGFAPKLPDVPEVYRPQGKPQLAWIIEYNEIEFAVLVAQGRVRCIEWYALDGPEFRGEIGFDHDLMVWCPSPGRFHEVVA